VIEVIEDLLCDLIGIHTLDANDKASRLKELAVELSHVLRKDDLEVWLTLQEVIELDPSFLEIFDISISLSH
jgi:hypothetical protein